MLKGYARQDKWGLFYPDGPPSVHFQSLTVRQFRERRVRFTLIPKGNRYDVRLLREVAAMSPAQILNRDLQVPVETNRILYVPAIHAKALLRPIHPIGANNLVQAGISR